MNKEIKLSVNDLKVSFRTDAGKVQAVRNISFDLYKRETLAIVGECGSGKSVTSKAIMGISAGNSIYEGGEILYDGQDLTRIPEEEMHKLRGDKIAMIFQDPLSSLNPIMRIGRQITEAMLLKNKTSRKEARDAFNKMLALLQTNMAEATGDEAKAKDLCAIFDKFCIQANALENSYNTSVATAEAMIHSINDVVFRLEKNQKVDVKATLRGYAKSLVSINDPFLTANYTEQMAQMQTALTQTDKVAESLVYVKDVLTEMIGQDRPDFFRIGFYTFKNPDEKLYGRNIAELNAMTLKYLDDNFMKAFIDMEVKGVQHSFYAALDKKKAVLDDLAAAKTFFAGEFDKKAALQYAKTLADKVEATIDRLEINKDSKAYTFRTSLNNAIEKYFFAVKNNPKEEARFARQSKKRDALIAKGKTVDWKVVPKVVYDLEELKGDFLKIISALETHYNGYIAAASQVDFQARSVGIIDYLKDRASKVVYKVTPAMAKERAIKLMEEVGINEPRMRYYQYPFEFSGGMRQRIVIAIALAADPEILICDEPTTALDVTIQAQILELINRLKEQRNLSVIFITHDLGVVANMADDIAVMYAGKIVEYGTADDIFYDPRHPYTWALLSSMPDLDTKEKLDAIPGTPPNMIYPPVGDAFAARNKYAMKIDFEEQPPMFEVSETHKAATWLLHPDAPKVELPKIITDRIARMKQKAGGAE